MSPAPFFWIAGLGVIWLGIYLVARQVSHQKTNRNDKTAKPVLSVREPGPAIGGEDNGTAGSSDAKRSRKTATGAARDAIVPGESSLPAATNAGPLVSPPRVLKPLTREIPVMAATLRRSPGNYTLDVSQTPFSGYDRTVLKDVQKRWLDVLAQKELIRGRTGKVVVECRLDAYGRVTELRVVENELDDLFAWLCQKAVLDPGRYPALPASLRRLMKNDYRQIRFTFYY